LQEELDVLAVPVKLAYTLREQLRRQAQQAAQQEMITSSVLVDTLAADVADQLPADIMQRRMPLLQQGGSSRLNARVRSTPLQSREPYSLEVTSAVVRLLLVAQHPASTRQSSP
jgi:hypothetical protein